jgi:hypothetical protein
MGHPCIQLSPHCPPCPIPPCPRPRNVTCESCLQDAESGMSFASCTALEGGYSQIPFSNECVCDACVPNPRNPLQGQQSCFIFGVGSRTQTCDLPRGSAVSVALGAAMDGAPAIWSVVGSGGTAAMGLTLNSRADQSSTPAVVNGIRVSGGTLNTSRLRFPRRAFTCPAPGNGSVTLPASGSGLLLSGETMLASKNAVSAIVCGGRITLKNAG